jgi:hypothetical protein
MSSWTEILGMLQAYVFWGVVRENESPKLFLGVADPSESMTGSGNP